MSERRLRAGVPGGWRHVWRLVSLHRLQMAALAIVSFVGASLEAGFLVLLTGTVIAMAADQQALTSMFGITVPVGAALGLAGIATFLRLMLGLVGARLSAALVVNVTVDERRRLSEGFLRASWAVQQAEPSGRLQELMGNFVARASFTTTAVTQAITATLSLLAFLGVGVAIDAGLTGGVVFALVVLGAVLAPLRHRIRVLSSRLAGSGLKFANSVAEFSSLGQEMHSFGAQQHFLDRIDELSRATAKDARRVAVAQGQLTPVYTFMAYAAVVSGIAAMWFLGVGDLAAIGAVMLLMLRSLSYAQQLLTVSGQFASSIPFLEEFDKILGGYARDAAHRGDAVPAAIAPLEMANVSFTYGSDRQALDGVSATIEAGELIGVVGPSGAGKSSLAQVLLGLRDPTSGRVMVHGVDLREVDRTWWAARVSFVPQDPILFTGSVADNLRFFRADISNEAIKRAAQQANVLADIERLPQGFDTHLGERGSQLSGGQRQRLSIARALAAGPDLLIMDEPTSALDGRSETLIRDTISQLRGRVTIIVIAHRISTLDLCDRIMVIEDGRMTAFESPPRLYEQSAYYRHALAAAGIAITGVGVE
ncbi:MAG: ABC transporter ATP-binding protein/permease [Actinobacteria bacterium]|nr:ABC transporter ATP-binding protein/permease [Actinomycetota bacterium]